MHDFPNTEGTRTVFPSSAADAKGAIDFPDSTIQDMLREDAAVDSEGHSLESDSTLEVEQHMPSVDLKLGSTQITADSKSDPQPITPESLKTPGDLLSTSVMSIPNISDEKKACDTESVEKVTHQLVVKTADQEKDTAQTKDFDASAKIGPQGRPSNSRSRRSRSRQYDEEGSSSDDDSYFAKHLPSPKSGRSFSYSSSGSVGAVASPYHPNNAGKESDASLSFSDESDEDVDQRAGVHVSPMIQPQGRVADMNLYPQRITRMHSVSSLVSSASSDDEKDGHRVINRSPGSSVSSYATSGTTSDPSVKAELHEVGIEGRPPSQLTEASGRRSPVMGKHAIPNYFYSTPSPVVSPPPIMQGYPPKQGVSHPQPVPMTHERVPAWNFNRASLSPSIALGPNYGATTHMTLTSHDGGFRDVFPPGSLMYREDTQADVDFFHQYSGGQDPSSNQFMSQQGRPGARNSRPQASGSLDENGVENDSPNGQTISSGRGRVATSQPQQRSAAFPNQEERGFKVYWQRWLMLFYMSVLNLLSDWTCYSVAPISLLTEEAFGNIDPERLVVVFLGANAIASISEPIILSRLGLRRTVLFGALLLMIGSIVKSGGVPPIVHSDITQGESAWRLYLGFFLVGLSQPLYQCTPTLLSSSWFPEEERTMATGVALNSNQVGIGFAFIFGTLLVGKKDDIIPYFGLLSTLSTIVFMGALIQFDDAPPTPPSASARVVRGTFDVKLPSINTIVESVRGGFNPNDSTPTVPPRFKHVAGAPSPAASNPVAGNSEKPKRSRKGNTRRRTAASRNSTVKESGLVAPSSARWGSTADVIEAIAALKTEACMAGVLHPSPMISGSPESPKRTTGHSTEGDMSPISQGVPGSSHEHLGLNQIPLGENPMLQGYPGMVHPGMPPPGLIPPPYPYPYWDPRFQQHMQQQQSYYQSYYPYQQPGYPPPPHPYYFPHGAYPPPYLAGYDYTSASFPVASELDDGAEPILTITPHHLDIDIRDDQVIRSMKACFARQGFIHALVAFTASGIVINTLSTYMDYLVRLNGAPRAYTGIVGGAFQFIIMISSLVIGKFTDTSRAYYSVTIAMLVLGAFGLAECGVSLDSDRGNDLRWCLIVVAALVGPLQPVSTELGVDVVYPLSENTVLVIQQLFSNLLSALFIPVFKALKGVGSEKIDDTEMFERPEYTFSFYLLIVIHTAATVFFATFNGKYLRYEHELERKAEEEEQDEIEREEQAAVHPFFRGPGNYGVSRENEPLLQNVI